MQKLEQIRRIVDEVLNRHRDRISTHYDGCWMNHAGCLALYIKMVTEHEEEDSDEAE